MSESSTDRFEVTIPTTPGREVRPNRNTGWSRRAGYAAIAEKKRLRGDTKRVVGSAMVDQGITAPFPADAHIAITVGWEKVRSPRYPNGRYRSNVDRHDTLPMMLKGVVDGLVDAGLIPDDAAITTEYRQERDPDGAGYIRIGVTLP